MSQCIGFEGLLRDTSLAFDDVDLCGMYTTRRDVVKLRF